jgi:hypothetical protein
VFLQSGCYISGPALQAEISKQSTLSVRECRISSGLDRFASEPSRLLIFQNRPQHGGALYQLELSAAEPVATSQIGLEGADDAAGALIGCGPAVEVCQR